MQILFINTPSSPQFAGGDLLQMRQTTKALKRLGVKVEESFDMAPNASGFDLAHVFNLRTIDVTAQQVEHLQKSGIPIVLSPIYLNPSLALWGTQLIQNIFSRSKDNQQIDDLLGQMARRTLKLKPAGGGNPLTAGAKNRPVKDYDERQRSILSHIRHLLPNSMLEMHTLASTLNVRDTAYTVVPYAVDRKTFNNPQPEKFEKKYGIRDFILQVGRIEPLKNQLMLAYALRTTDVPLVLIGEPSNADYVELVRKFGPKRLLILPHIEQEELRNAYAAARVHALPSWFESCGLVSMEAAFCGCNIVVGQAGYEFEYYRDMAYYCDPADVTSIRTAVIAAFEGYDRDSQRRERLIRTVENEYTWEKAAELTRQAYEQVLHG